MVFRALQHGGGVVCVGGPAVLQGHRPAGEEVFPHGPQVQHAALHQGKHGTTAPAAQEGQEGRGWKSLGTFGFGSTSVSGSVREGGTVGGFVYGCCVQCARVWCGLWGP